MWSLGVICFQVLMGDLPIADDTPDDIKVAMLLGYAPVSQSGSPYMSLSMYLHHVIRPGSEPG